MYHASESPACTIHCAHGALQGQLLTREGLTLTEDPEVFQLSGVYIAATGRLHAKVEPASGPVTVALADNESTVHPAAYRRASSVEPWPSEKHELQETSFT